MQIWLDGLICWLLGLRNSYKELIWCINHPNVHIHTFRKGWSFIWGYFCPVSIFSCSFIVYRISYQSACRYQAITWLINALCLTILRQNLLSSKSKSSIWNHIDSQSSATNETTNQVASHTQFWCTLNISSFRWMISPKWFGIYA